MSLLYIYGCIGFASVLLGNFAFMFIRDISLKFSFVVMSLSGFDIRVILALQSKLKNFPFAFFLEDIVEN